MTDGEIVDSGDFDIDVVRNAIRDVVNGNPMVGDIVVLAELVNPDGVLMKLVMHNADITYWKEIGLLHSRLYDIASGGFDVGPDDDEDD